MQLSILVMLGFISRLCSCRKIINRLVTLPRRDLKYHLWLSFSKLARQQWEEVKAVEKHSGEKKTTFSLFQLILPQKQLLKAVLHERQWAGVPSRGIIIASPLHFIGTLGNLFPFCYCHLSEVWGMQIIFSIVLFITSPVRILVVLSR